MFALSLLATGLSIQFIIHRPQAAAPLAPLAPPIPHHPLSVKADCFHANRVLGASTLSHYIRQREDRERKKRGERESLLYGLIRQHWVVRASMSNSQNTG